MDVLLFVAMLAGVLLAGLSIQRNAFPTDQQWEETREYIWRGETPPSRDPFGLWALLAAVVVILLTLAGAGG